MAVGVPASLGRGTQQILKWAQAGAKWLKDVQVRYDGPVSIVPTSDATAAHAARERLREHRAQWDSRIAQLLSRVAADPECLLNDQQRVDELCILCGVVTRGYQPGKVVVRHRRADGQCVLVVTRWHQPWKVVAEQKGDGQVVVRRVRNRQVDPTLPGKVRPRYVKAGLLLRLCIDALEHPIAPYRFRRAREAYRAARAAASGSLGGQHSTTGKGAKTLDPQKLRAEAIELLAGLRCADGTCWQVPPRARHQVNAVLVKRHDVTRQAIHKALRLVPEKIL